MKVHKYADIIREYFYLDANNVLRYAKQGYLNRYNQDDVVKPFIKKSGYEHIQIPTVRGTINISHVMVLLYYRNLPKKFQVDHIDGNRSNNSIDNLRLVDNTSGITGVRYEPARHNAKPYCVRVTIDKVRITKYVKTIEEAKALLKEFRNLDGNYTDRHGK